MGKCCLRDLVKILRDSPHVTVLWKLSLSRGGSCLRGEVGWDRVAYWKTRRFSGEAGADYLPSGSNEVKVWRRWSGFLLLDCCGWVKILGSAWVEIFWGWTHWETELGVKAAGAGTWWPGSPHGSRMGYLPCLVSCRLLQLNAGAQGEHLTSQLSWAAAY